MFPLSAILLKSRVSPETDNPAEGKQTDTAAFSEAEARPHLVFIRAGTLDNPSLARPAATIWAAQAPAWACIDETLPRWEEQPPPVDWTT